MSTREIVAPGSTFGGLSRYALDAIKGKWGVTIGAFVLACVIKGAAQQVPIAGPLAAYLLIPLDVGIMLFCLRLIRREKTPIEGIFDPFSDYWRYLWGGIRVGLVILLWALPLTLDGIAICLLLFAGSSDSGMVDQTVVPYLIFCGVLFPFLFIPVAVACLRYAMTLYIMIDHPEYRAKDAMEESDAIMYGHKWQYFGYSLLIVLIAFPVALFTLGIGFFWLIPWAGVFTASFYESVRRREEPSIPEEAAKAETAG